MMSWATRHIDEVDAASLEVFAKLCENEIQDWAGLSELGAYRIGRAVDEYGSQASYG